VLAFPDIQGLLSGSALHRSWGLAAYQPNGHGLHPLKAGSRHAILAWWPPQPVRSWVRSAGWRAGWLASTSRIK